MKPRVTIVEKVYCAVGKFAQAFSADCSWHLSEDEQPYDRLIKVKDGAWQLVSIPADWIKEPSLIMVKNEMPVRTKTQTEAEKAEDAARVIELAVGHVDDLPPIPFALVRPGRSIKFEPVTLSARYFVRCGKGTVQARIVALPRQL